MGELLGLSTTASWWDVHSFVCCRLIYLLSVERPTSVWDVSFCSLYVQLMDDLKAAKVRLECTSVICSVPRISVSKVCIRNIWWNIIRGVWCDVSSRFSHWWRSLWRLLNPGDLMRGSSARVVPAENPCLLLKEQGRFVGYNKDRCIVGKTRAKIIDNYAYWLLNAKYDLKGKKWFMEAVKVYMDDVESWRFEQSMDNR